jgi:prepilin signal peptidase PulO-like enzyme (type II secretory pathway)
VDQNKDMDLCKILQDNQGNQYNQYNQYNQDNQVNQDIQGYQVNKDNQDDQNNRVNKDCPLIPTIFNDSIYSGSIYTGCIQGNTSSATVKKDIEKRPIEKRPVFWFAVIISAAALFFALQFFKEFDLVTSLKLLCLYCFLVPVAIVDYRHHIIPNRFLPICAAIALLFGIFEVLAGMSILTEKVLDMIIGLLLGGGVFGLAAILTKGGVGMGDVKLFAVLGLVLGFHHTFCLILYTLICTTVIGALLIVTRRANAKTRLAMGPFVLAGMISLITLG